ncbi:MAG TPA: ABC transporter substrate-binding protein [Candidatus Limnocylindrales bacterium]|nr:ABC transporter substrate-binding protein [Candidatus Limnocylindrales bacterium]
MKTRPILALAATTAIAFAACTSGATPSPSASTAPPSAPAASSSAATGSDAPATTAPEPASVRLQLQWTPQAQFAGYFAADAQGFYEAEGLTVEMVDGGPTIAPHTVGSAPDGPEFTISWVPKVLEAREQGSDLVNIAQVFQRSGTLSVTWKDSGITSPCGFAGKKVGVWDFGNEYEVTAAALACGLQPGLEAGGNPAETYQKVIQNFDMVAFLNREIDVAEAMIYNEYAQVLEATNPETGQLYKPEDLNVIDYNQERSAMLQDAIFVRKAWLDEGNNRDIAVRFLRASFRGWIYCRENQDDCIQYTVDAGSQLGAGHQRWMMNEILPLIFPSPKGIGMMDPVFWQQSVMISKNAGIIKADPSIDAYTTDLAEEALSGITEDAIGEDFEKGTVEVTPGGN